MKEVDMFKKLLCVLIMALGLTACTKSENIEGNEYVMLDAPNGAEITLMFSDTDNRASGKVVNRYFGTYTIDGNKLTFGPMASTMMMGPRDLMEAEQNYLKELPKVKTFKLEGNKLKLYTEDDKELVFDEMTSLDEENAPANNRYTRKAMENRKEK